MYPLEQQQTSNRTGVDILASILQVTSNRTLKTHIMYRANLSHRQLERYLEYLEKNGMLEEVADGKVNLFRITEKGIEFLKDYSRISKYLFSKDCDKFQTHENSMRTLVESHV